MPNNVHLVRKRPACASGLADRERRHVVEEPLVQVVARDDDERVGARLRERGALLLDQLRRARDRLLPAASDRTWQRRVVRDAQDGDELRHQTWSPSRRSRP